MKGIRANLINNSVKKSLNTINHTNNSLEYKDLNVAETNKDIADCNDFRKENEKHQNETKALIAKTKNLIESFNANTNNAERKPRSFSTGKGLNDKINYEEAIRTKPKSPSPNNETRGVLEKFNNSLLNSQANLKNYLNLNNSALQEKLLEKLKYIKYLERELKEKNNLIRTLHSRLDKQNYEMNKMLEVIKNEKTNSLKVEICQLNRKLKEKEKQIEDERKVFENSISEFKVKISNMIAHNDACTAKIEELELYNRDLKQRVVQEEDKVEQLNNKYESLIVEHRNHIDSSVDNQKKASTNNTKTKELIRRVFDLFQSFSNLNLSSEAVYKKAISFYSEHDYFTYATDKVNNSDYLTSLGHNQVNTNHNLISQVQDVDRNQNHTPGFNYNYNNIRQKDLYSSMDNKQTQVSTEGIRYKK